MIAFLSWSQSKLREDFLDVYNEPINSICSETIIFSEYFAFIEFF